MVGRVQQCLHGRVVESRHAPRCARNDAGGRISLGVGERGGSVRGSRSTVCGVDGDLRSVEAAGLTEEVASLRALTACLQAENARLLRLLELTSKQAAPPGPVQTGFFEAPPGPVDRLSPPEVKVDFFGALFAARRDIYAVRWENTRTGMAGCLRSGAGGAGVCGTRSETICR